MTKIALELKGITERKEFFGAAIARAEDLSPAFGFVHRMWIEEIEQQFATQGKFFTGAQWKPLNPAYAKWKERHYQVPAPYGILYATGRLHQSFVDKSHEKHVSRITADSAVFGSVVDYGKYHQTGTKIMPQRKLVVKRNRFVRNVFRSVVSWILRGKLPE